jgi:hypothetical protein
MQHEYVYPVVRPLPPRMIDASVRPSHVPQVASTTTAQSALRRYDALRAAASASVHSMSQPGSAQLA